MLVLASHVYDGILAHAREASPQEACGLLAGSRDEHAIATAMHRATNIAPNPERTYEIDAEEQYRLMGEIDAAGQSVVGFYHSHPAGPHGPSTTDHARATLDGYHYLIASLGGPEPVLDAWRWTGSRFERDPVAVRDLDPE